MISASKAGGALALRKYDKQMAAQCITAIAYAQVYPIDQWNPTDIDKIMETGRELHRTSTMRNKIDENIHPTDVETNFYIDFTKITTLVGGSRISGYFKSDDNEHLVHCIFDILTHSLGCIIGFGQKFYAMRIDSSGFYMFCPCAMDNEYRFNKNIINGTACCIRLPITEDFSKCLTAILQPTTKMYELISVEILKLTELSKYPEENPVTEMSMQFDSGKSVMGEEVKSSMTNSLLDDDDVAILDEVSSIQQNLPNAFDVAPYLDDFSQAYRTIADGREILRACSYVDQVSGCLRLG